MSEYINHRKTWDAVAYKMNRDVSALFRDKTPPIWGNMALATPTRSLSAWLFRFTPDSQKIVSILEYREHKIHYFRGFDIKSGSSEEQILGSGFRSFAISSDCQHLILFDKDSKDSYLRKTTTVFPINPLESTAVQLERSFWLRPDDKTGVPDLDVEAAACSKKYAIVLYQTFNEEELGGEIVIWNLKQKKAKRRLFDRRTRHVLGLSLVCTDDFVLWQQCHPQSGSKKIYIWKHSEAQPRCLGSFASPYFSNDEEVVTRPLYFWRNGDSRSHPPTGWPRSIRIREELGILSASPSPIDASLIICLCGDPDMSYELYDPWDEEKDENGELQHYISLKIALLKVADDEPSATLLGRFTFTSIPFFPHFREEGPYDIIRQERVHWFLDGEHVVFNARDYLVVLRVVDPSGHDGFSRNCLQKAKSSSYAMRLVQKVNQFLSNSGDTHVIGGYHIAPNGRSICVSINDLGQNKTSLRVFSL